MGVKCVIIFDQSKFGVFRAGEPVVGILKYFIKKPTKFQSIDVCLVGKGKCHWTDSTSEDNTEYYHNKEKYVNLSKNILSARNVRNESNVLSGTYEHPFELFVPENIPTSFKNKFCKIEYKVFATFTKDNFFATKYKFDVVVPVYGNVNPCSPEPLIFGVQKKLFSLLGDYNVNVKAEIEKTFLTPGENIKLRLTIHNDTNVPIKIKTELIQHFTYIAQRKGKKIDEQPVKSATGLSPFIIEKTMTVVTGIIPTLPNLYSIQHTKILRGEYKVRVTAKLPFPHTNAVVEVPVVIGENRKYMGAKIIGYARPSSSKGPGKDQDYLAKYDKRFEDFRGKMFS